MLETTLEAVKLKSADKKQESWDIRVQTMKRLVVVIDQ